MREQYLQFSFYIYKVFQYIIVIAVVVIVIALIMTPSKQGSAMPGAILIHGETKDLTTKSNVCDNT